MVNLVKFGVNLIFINVIYLLIINYYSTELIKKLISSIYDINFSNYQIIIINNSPEDQSIQSLNSDNTMILNNQENLGFGKACNVGLNYIYQQDQSALIWLINPDTYFQEINFDNITNFFQKYSDISILGTIIYTPEQKVWFGGGIFQAKKGDIIETNLFDNNFNQDYLICDWVSGCSMIINLKNFDNCPQFDLNYFLYYEDVDFCLRYQKQGHKIAITNQFSLIHNPSSITNRNLTNKMFYSTYSYLLTLKKYTNLSIFMLKFTKLLVNSLFLIILKPLIAIGKIKGIYYFFNNK